MPCYAPLVAYQCTNGAIVFTDNLARNDVHKQLLLPCGQCVGCRLERSRVWAARCMHHAQMHTDNAFITLTYDDEHLTSPSLNHRDFQLFMKRLRKSVSVSSNKKQSDPDRVRKSQTVRKISYYMAGEYGDKTRRPHFHACIFGWTPSDKIYWRSTTAGSRLYTSTELTELWKKGFTSIGDVNFESAAYIARYIMNKQTGPGAWKYYEHIDDETGEITDLKPEYNKMSLGKNNAIGKSWLQKYKTDVYPDGEILVRQKKTKTPKYYDKLYKQLEPDNYEEMKNQREIQALQYRDDNTPARLKAKETVKKRQIQSLLRTI
ncbi:MAG: replication initiator protein [Microviridae sp.]|nr:MAG: replication initiator protein [Microviridae sp.]